MAIRIGPAIVLLPILIGSTQVGSAQNNETPTSTKSTSAENIKEALSRKMRFGWRELDLPLKLDNGKLKVANDGLDNDIAKLQGGDQDLTRIIIDRFLLDQVKAAVQVANWFAQAWSPNGNKDLQHKLSDIEQRFDEATMECHPTHAEGEATVLPRTLEEAQANCAAFREIYRTVSQYQIKVSIPPPSVFKHNSTLVSTGEQLLRSDTMQLNLDMAAHRPAAITKDLISADQQLIGMDKMIWLLEIDEADINNYNKTHPEDRMADVSDLVKSTVDTRQGIGDASKRERQALLAIQKQGH